MIFGKPECLLVMKIMVFFAASIFIRIHAQHLGDGVHGVHEHHFTERVLIIWFVSKRNLHIKYVGVGRAPENIIF